MNRFRRRPLALIVAALVVLAISLIAAALPAQASARTAAAPSVVASLSREVRAGTLLADHGTRAVCPHCDSLVVTRSPGSTRPLSTTAPAGYGPADLARAFHLPAGTSGARTTIAIIDAGVDPKLESDLAVYRARYGLPPCTQAAGCLRLTDYQSAQQPVPPTSGEGRYVNEDVAVETSLDMDLASAACPSCRLIEVSVPWQDALDGNDVSTSDFTTATAKAERLGAHVVSISYGYLADRANTSGRDLAVFSRPGVEVVASTGDDGFNGGVHQAWPSDLPDVTAVGGTTLRASGAQIAWYSAGSGCETRFAAAAGQPKSVAALCNGHRGAADIAADADPATGPAIYDTYAPSSHHPIGWTVVGGTSASAPYIGGLFGRVGDLAGALGPRSLYRAPSSDITDVTSGKTFGEFTCSQQRVSPRLCTGAPGWDGPTGLGVPDGLGAFHTTGH